MLLAKIFLLFITYWLTQEEHDRITLRGSVLAADSISLSLLAKMISRMDVISNGRMELGIIAGWFKDEYLAYGYDHPKQL
jgi:alkanesulfonate monooxygenase SsuD/methylene tetrahydromethanopterin reductase-like flavin-dependent oxidoreductase (luciferase family)